MAWTWDERKSAANRRKHGLGFETAVLVFEDAHAFSNPDPFAGEDRWNTIGRIGGVTIFVVHTDPVEEGGTGRIISARKATSHERRAYEEGEF
ncbi:MAG: BrnT family toxin [Hyphomicrobiales bacterium]